MGDDVDITLIFHINELLGMVQKQNTATDYQFSTFFIILIFFLLQQTESPNAT